VITKGVNKVNGLLERDIVDTECVCEIKGSGCVCVHGCS